MGGGAEQQPDHPSEPPLHPESVPVQPRWQLETQRSERILQAMNIQAIVHPAEEGGFWAEVPSLPGCMTEGENMEELKANLLEAVQGWAEAADARARKLAGADSTILALAV